jgi:hypothetical protein
MTEAEWLAGTDPTPMLVALRSKASDRNLRLFAVASCRRVQNLFANDCDRETVGLVERFADGLASREELEAVPALTNNNAVQQAAAPLARGAARNAAAACSALRAAAAGDYEHPRGQGDCYAAELGEKTAQCRLLHELFGNPFRPSTFDLAWRTWNGGTVPKMAQAIYDSRLLPSGHLDAAQLAVLADALEEAGCDQAEVLYHLRRPGPHIRGCWAVDLLLGKE